MFLRMVVPQAILDNRFDALSSTGVILEQKKLYTKLCVMGYRIKNASTAFSQSLVVLY